MKTISVATALRTAVVAFGLVVGLSAFVHPAGPVRSVERNSNRILEGSGAPQEVRAIFERSCQNCHSEHTEWPWYSYVAPISWMIEEDVSEARREMDLSRWPTYTNIERIGMLSSISPLVSNRVMPPQRYLPLHPEAKLSAEEIGQLVRWAREERKSLAITSVR